MKRKFAVLPATLGILCWFTQGADAAKIKNNAKPLAPNAGRVIKLEQISRISDESGAFYLKNPSRISIAEDGRFYVLDENEVLSFGADGVFKANLQKKGEGPGEFVYALGVFPGRDNVLIYALNPAKAVEFGADNRFRGEYKVDPGRGMKRVVAHQGDTFWFLRADMPQIMKQETGLKVLKVELFRETKNQSLHKTPLTFDEEWSIRRIQIKDNIQFAMTLYTPSNFVADSRGKIMWLHNTRNYSIWVVDLEKETITGAVSRPYKPVRYASPPKEDTPSGVVRVGEDAPEPENFPDVCRILQVKNQIWAFTSTIDKDKGVLVDVFSSSGQYTDCFYLPLPQVKTPHDLKSLPLAVMNNILATVETDGEGAPQIVRYRLSR